MGKFEKGKEKTGGRKKGSLNKTSIAGKQKIAEYFENGGLEELVADIAKLEDKDRVQAKIKLIEYYIPKQKEVDFQSV